MSTLTTVSLLLGIAIALWCGWYCRRVAGEKGRRRLLWSILGVALNVVAVPVLLALPAKRDAVDAAQSGIGDVHEADGGG